MCGGIKERLNVDDLAIIRLIIIIVGPQLEILSSFCSFSTHDIAFNTIYCTLKRMQYALNRKRHVEL